jgi:probable blue pigment (indigoidine) exporter
MRPASLDVEHLDKEPVSIILSTSRKLTARDVVDVLGTARVVLVTAAAPAVWGSTYVVTTELLPDGRPLLAAALRALPAGLLLLLVTRELPTGAWWWRSAVLGTLNIGAFFALLFVSAYRLPGGVAALLGAAGPLLVAGLSALLLAERFSARRLLAGVLAAVGVGLTVVTSAAELDPVGVLAGTAGTASMSFGVVLTKKWPRPTSVLTATGWQLSAGGLLLLPLALAVEGLPATLSATNLAGYAYLSVVGSALAYAVWFRGIDRLPAFSVSLLGPVSPLVATLLGWAVLGQRLTGLQMVGAAVALGGVVAGQGPGRSAARTTPGVLLEDAQAIAGGAEGAARSPDPHTARTGGTPALTCDSVLTCNVARSR